MGEVYGYMCVLNRVFVIVGLIRLIEGSWIFDNWGYVIMLIEK